eukprot:2871670-Amphidinium_carterae.2
MQRWAAMLFRGTSVCLLGTSCGQVTSLLKDKSAVCGAQYLKDGEVDQSHKNVCNSADCEL